MNKYFTVTLLYGTDYTEVLNNVEKIETTDTDRLMITHWLYVGTNNSWCRTKELVNLRFVSIVTCFDLHELER